MRSAQRGLVRSFPTPTVGMPASVAKAAKAFDEANARLTRAEVEVEDGKRAILAARAADEKAFDDAVRKGNDRAVLKKDNEADAVLALASAERRVKSLEGLVDEAGDALARSIGEAKAGWTADLEEAEARATEAYLRAVDALERTMGDVAAARMAAEWLSRYETGAALTQDNRHDVIYRNPPARFPLDIPRNLDRVRGVALIPTDALFGSLRGAVEPAPTPQTTVNAAATVTPYARVGSS